MSDLSQAHYTLILTSNTQQYSFLWKTPDVLWKDSQWNNVLDCYTLCYLLFEFSTIVLWLQMANVKLSGPGSRIPVLAPVTIKSGLAEF